MLPVDLMRSIILFLRVYSIVVDANRWAYFMAGHWDYYFRR